MEIIYKLNIFDCFEKKGMTLNLENKEEMLDRNTQVNCYQIDMEEEEMLLDELEIFQETNSHYPKIQPLRFQQLEDIDNYQRGPLQNALFKYTEDEEEQNKSSSNAKFQIDDIQNENMDNSAFVYKDLILKLELALRKILANKKGNHRAKTEVSSQKYDLQKKRKLSQLYAVTEELYHNHEPKGKNKYMTTSTTFGNKIHHEVIHDRSALYSDRIKLKNETERKHVLIKSDTSFPEQINEHPNKKYELQRKTKQFLENMVMWQEKKDKKNQERILKNREIFKTEATFVPTINVKSKLLMKKKGEALPIFERLVKSKKSDNNQPEGHKK